MTNDDLDPATALAMAMAERLRHVPPDELPFVMEVLQVARFLRWAPEALARRPDNEASVARVGDSPVLQWRKPSPVQASNSPTQTQDQVSRIAELIESWGDVSVYDLSVDRAAERVAAIRAILGEGTGSTTPTRPSEETAQ